MAKQQIGKLEEFEKFEVIVNFQKKKIEEVLNQFIRNYNNKYNEDYNKALESFWND